VRIRIYLIFLASLTIASGVTNVAGGGTAEAAASAACYGLVACAGQSPATDGCTGTQLESLVVTGLGTLQLFESGVCGTAWAVLTFNQTAYPNYPSEAFNDGYTMIAEILYEPPQGGVEQYSTVPWNPDQNPTLPSPEVITTTMVPLGGSIKACAGSPDGSGDPFDMDPQGSTEFIQNPSGSTVQGTFSLGGCTLWH
jgi:hypothetical protein